MTDEIVHIRWRSQPGDGLEHCAIRETAGSVSLEGIAITARTGAMRYRIVLDAEWAGVRSVHLTPIGGATLALRHDGYGGWTDGEGKERKEFLGLTEVVVPGSAVTLMVILKRFAARGGKTLRFEAIACDSMTLQLGRIGGEVATLEAGTRFRVRVGDGEAVEATLGADTLLTTLGDDLARIALS